MNSQEHESFFGRIVSQGWVANIGVAVIFTAITQASLWGVILGILAVSVLLITTARFKAPDGSAPWKTTVFQTATRVGVGLAALCILSSLYVSFRPILLNQLPKEALEIVLTEATSDQAEMVTIQSIPPLPANDRNKTILGLRSSESYQVISALLVADRILGEGLSTVEYVLKFAIATLCVWFVFALIVGWFAEDFWRSNPKM